MFIFSAPCTLIRKEGTWEPVEVIDGMVPTAALATADQAPADDPGGFGGRLAYTKGREWMVSPGVAEEFAEMKVEVSFSHGERPVRTNLRRFLREQPAPPAPKPKPVAPLLFTTGQQAVIDGLAARIAALEAKDARHRAKTGEPA